MDEHIWLVKSQISWLTDQIIRYSPDHPRYRPDLIERYQRLLSGHRALLSFLEDLRQKGAATVEREPNPPDPPVTDRLHVNGADDLSDLPEELLKELSGGSKAEADPLVRIINDRGGSASLDQILVDLYRKYGQLGKRTITANKLYRLSKRGLLWVLPGKKGIYSTKPPIEDGEERRHPEKDLFYPIPS